MAEIVLFRPRPKPPAAPQPVPRATLRDEIEEAGHVVADAMDRIVALLDRIDADPDLEPGGDDEPSLGAPEEHGNNVVRFRGTARDLELDRQDEAETTHPPASTLMHPDNL